MNQPVSAFRAKIDPELAALVRPMADATPHPDNSRKHNLGAIAKSLQAHGQRTPIVVQASSGFIVKGNGTWLAASTILGWDALAQSWQELDDQQALAYLVADNRASDLSGYDNTKLAKVLRKLAEGPGLMDTLWTLEELADLDDEVAGLATAAPQPTDAAYADNAEAAAAAQVRPPGTKMKEVPVVLTESQHAEFVGWLKTLQRRFGTTGSVATIFEAVRRQATAEEEAVELGRDIPAEREAQIRRQLVVDLRAMIAAMPDGTVTRAKLYATLEHAAPPVASVTGVTRTPDVLPGQVPAFEDEQIAFKQAELERVADLVEEGIAAGQEATE